MNTRRFFLLAAASFSATVFVGNLAIQYGYQRFDVGVMIATIVILIVLVQVLQFVGDRVAQQLRKR